MRNSDQFHALDMTKTARLTAVDATAAHGVRGTPSRWAAPSRKPGHSRQGAQHPRRGRALAQSETHVHIRSSRPDRCRGRPWDPPARARRGTDTRPFRTGLP
ncbi:hypothetical protein GCM10023082_12790 [Streptomyces tremellae]|uniref:FXSXX-COOH protein n=1 Tax=Streptomyces tremellae TaxID=1124239 RepID=A0ABP7EAQ0_9ACTN